MIHYLADHPPHEQLGILKQAVFCKLGILQAYQQLTLAEYTKMLLCQLGLSLLCSEKCLLCFLELLQFCTYYARFYATPQSIMVLIIHNLIYISISSLVYEPPVTSTYSINSDLPHASGIKGLNKIIIINFRGA